jgi:hypothetical protein
MIRRLAAWWRRRRARRVRSAPPIQTARDAAGRVMAWCRPLDADELAELAARPGRRERRAGWLDHPRESHTRRTP